MHPHHIKDTWITSTELEKWMKKKKHIVTRWHTLFHPTTKCSSNIFILTKSKINNNHVKINPKTKEISDVGGGGV